MPAMTPPPWMFSAPSSSCMLRPASVESSRNGEPRSSRWASRWRGVSWPRFWNIGSFWLEVSRTRPLERAELLHQREHVAPVGLEGLGIRVDLDCDSNVPISPPPAPSAVIGTVEPFVGRSRSSHWAASDSRSCALGTAPSTRRVVPEIKRRALRQQKHDRRRHLAFSSEPAERDMCLHARGCGRPSPAGSGPCRTMRSSPAPPH